MKRTTVLLLATVLFLLGATTRAQTSNATSSGSLKGSETGAVVPTGTVIAAQLTTELDAKQAREGDPVQAKATAAVNGLGKMVVPAGATIVGHVTKAKAGGKSGATSALGIAFDKAILKDGQEVAISGRIRALASGELVKKENEEGVDLDGNESRMAKASGKVLSGGREMPKELSNIVKADGQLTENSRGVYGLEGMQLTTDTGSGGGAVIVSNKEDVRLDSGTILLIESKN